MDRAMLDTIFYHYQSLIAFIDQAFTFTTKKNFITILCQ